jgi:NAD/NADP transhydrogenase beta subunit
MAENARYAEPEVMPPRPHGARTTLSDENLDHLATLLDDIFRIPGTHIRFGLDPVIGLIPGLGDVITSLLSFLIIFAAWKRRLPGVTLARMVANVAIDTIVGAVPFAGDAFDVAWKSNRMNMRLLQRDAGRTHAQTWRDWLYLAIIGLVLIALAALPVLVLVWIIQLIRR